MWEKNFHKKKLFDAHSTASIQPLAVLKKISFKKPIFFLKKQFLNVFENFQYFSHILRQICYKLMMKNIQIHNRPPVVLSGQSASKRKKMHRVE